MSNRPGFALPMAILLITFMTAGVVAAFTRIESEHWEAELRGLIEEHVRQTGSPRAKGILAHWDEELGRFWQVCPKEMITRLSHPLSDRAAEATA